MSLFDSASLIVTPNAYKAGKLYSLKPTDGAGDLSVTRATSATRVDANGLIEIPRTNLLLRSEEFDNVAWAKSAGATVTANAGISPDGTMTADRIVFTGVNQFVNQSNTLSAVAHYGSVYVKGTLGETIRFTVGGTEATRTLTGEWQRIELLRATAPSNGNFTISTFANVTARDILIWGAQLEAGNSATEYIPTTSLIRTKFAGITQDGGSASNIPRIDYTNGSCPSILVEPQRTNLITYSEQIDNAIWLTLGTITKTANQTISPDGVLNADLILGADLNSSVSQLYIGTTGVIYTFSFFIKNNNSTTSQLFVRQNLSAVDARLNWSGNELTSITNVIGTTTFEDYGNGWYRIKSTYTSLETIQRGRIVPTRNTNQSVYIWGAQLEAGANATSYIPTVASAVTRNADVISKTGISDLIGQTEGTLFVDVDFSNLASKNESNRLVELTDGTFSNRIIIAFANPNSLLTRVSFNGVEQASFTANVSLGRLKVMLSYSSSGVRFYVNGILSQSNSSANIPATNRFNLGYLATTTQSFLNDRINLAALWKTKLTDTECINLTTL